MSTPDSANPINHVDLAAYLMDLLDAEQRRRADEHLTECAECRAEVDSMREWSAALAAIPEAMLLDGPPDDADLLLQRTLRQVRTESAGHRSRRTAMLAAAAAAVIAVAIGGGVVVGRTTAPTPLAEPSSASTTAGARGGTAVGAEGARMTVVVTPASGWVRVNATVTGVRAGERCRLEVIGRDGSAVLAGSWLASKAGETNGTVLNGSALIDPAQVASVRVTNVTGEQYVDVPV
jgi:hypothetical protein